MEKTNITVLAHLVFANFHPGHKRTQHRAQTVLFRTTQFVNSLALEIETIAIDGYGGLPIEKTNKRIDHSRKMTGWDCETARRVLTVIEL
jgi:hypothetical protein